MMTRLMSSSRIYNDVCHYVVGFQFEPTRTIEEEKKNEDKSRHRRRFEAKNNFLSTRDKMRKNNYGDKTVGYYLTALQYGGVELHWPLKKKINK